MRWCLRAARLPGKCLKFMHRCSPLFSPQARATRTARAAAVAAAAAATRSTRTRERAVRPCVLTFACQRLPARLAVPAPLHSLPAQRHPHLGAASPVSSLPCMCVPSLPYVSVSSAFLSFCPRRGLASRAPPPPPLLATPVRFASPSILHTYARICVVYGRHVPLGSFSATRRRLLPGRAPGAAAGYRLQAVAAGRVALSA